MAKRKHDQADPEPEDKAAERLRQFYDARYAAEESRAAESSRGGAFAGLFFQQTSVPSASPLLCCLPEGTAKQVE